MMSAATPPDDAWSPPCSLQESPPPTHSSFLGSEGRLASPVSFHQCAGGAGQTGYKFESPHGEVPCSPPLNRSSANVSFEKFYSLSCHHLFLISAQSCVAISYISLILHSYFLSQLSLAYGSYFLSQLSLAYGSYFLSLLSLSYFFASVFLSI